MKLLLLLLLSVLLPMAKPDETATVEYSFAGRYIIAFEGLKTSTKSKGTTFYKYRGIPYALPPTGKRRFLDPMPINYAFNHKKQVVNATRDGSACLQIDMLNMKDGLKVAGQEDCLTLNVYTPTFCPSFNCHGSLLPVMVFIHGGGFVMGSGLKESVGPDLFMDQQSVILVTINYRLGPLGYLTLGDEHISGNQGMKDQVLALQWVSKHVEAFGGDNSRVTIFGESAGGMSVHSLLLSPLTKGLFQRVIIQSGTALQLQHVNERRGYAERLHKKFVQEVGCGSEFVADRISCLQNVDANKLILTGMPKANIMDALQMSQLLEVPFFLPVVDEYARRPFMPTDPWQLAKERSYNDVEMMIGATKDEGCMFLFALIKNLDAMSEMWSQVAGYTFLFKGANTTNDEENRLLNIIRRYYTDGKSFKEDDDLEGLLQMFTDGTFGLGTYLTAMKASEKGGKVFLYELSHKPTIGLGDIVGGAIGIQNTGLTRCVCHADDLFFMFNVSFSDDAPAMTAIITDQDRTVSNAMIKTWTNFAAFGDPTPSEDDGLARWESFTPDNKVFYDFNGLMPRTASMDMRNKEERMVLWEKTVWDYQRSQDHSHSDGAANEKKASDLQFPDYNSSIACLGEQLNASGSFCMPGNKPEGCVQDVWERLNKAYNWPPCKESNPDRASPQSQHSFPSVQISEDLQVCLGSFTPRGHKDSHQCLPRSKPNVCEDFRKWQETKIRFSGEVCPI